MTRAEQFAQWVSGLQLSDIPVDLLQQMRRHLLDAIGVGVLGGRARIVEQVAQVFAAPGGAHAFGSRSGRDLCAAARVNAVAMHCNELDDTEGCDHTGAVVVPAVLALLDKAGGAIPAGALLPALVAGYECGRRLQNALGGYDAHNGAGWHSSATCGVFAAAAAAARMLQLSPAQTMSALGIAASSSAGSWAFLADGAQSKVLHVANAAAGGLSAALLAAAGVRGPAYIFEDVWGGFFQTHGAGAAAPDELVTGLGVVWRARHSAIKLYASCRSTHPPLDGFYELLGSGVAPDAIEQITIEVSPLLRRMICPEVVDSAEAARMSLPYCLALILAGEKLVPDNFLRFADAGLRAAIRNMRVQENNGLPSEQTVRLLVDAGGERRVIERERARGCEEDPLGDAAVRDKFIGLIGEQVGGERAAAFADEVLRMPVDAPDYLVSLSAWVWE